MTLRHLILLIIACVSLPFSVRGKPPRPFTVVGYGNVSCSAWKDARHTRDAQLLGYSGWLEGYVTAFNQWGDAGRSKNVMGKFQIEALEVGIDNYCIVHPSDQLLDAAAIIVRHLLVRQIDQETIEAIGKAAVSAKPRP